MTTIVNQFVKFAGVGIIGTAAHYILLIIIVEVFNRDPVSGSAVGFLGGALVNYYLNRHYTFKSDARHMVAVEAELLEPVARHERAAHDLQRLVDGAIHQLRLVLLTSRSSLAVNLPLLNDSSCTLWPLFRMPISSLDAILFHYLQA